MLDIRQTPEYANYLKEIGWIVKRINGVNYFIKKFPIIGSVIKIQRPEKIDNQTIKKLTRKSRAFQIILEPKNQNQELIVKNLGFKLSKHPYLPTKTLQLDLTKSKNQLLKEIKKDGRYALRKTMNHELQTVNLETKDFQKAWKKSVGLKRYVPPLSHLNALKELFKENCVFLSCINASKVIIGGGIFLAGDKVGYYWQAFTNKEGRKSFAQYKIVWEGIIWTKKRGAKVFDFEGIYDERFPDKTWLGFSHFKKSFGGYEVKYPGVFTKQSFLHF